MKKIWLISFIFLLTLAATIVSLPYGIHFKIGKFSVDKKFDLKLGLDLAGGSHLVFDADMKNISGDRKKEALDGVRNVIERRVNLFGVSEPTVQTSSFEGRDRIIVELPGISDTKQAVSLIGKTAQLLFVEIVEEPAKNNATPSAVLKPTDLTGADLEKAQVVFDSQTGKPAISLQFAKDGGTKFEKITQRNIGKPLPIILDSQIIKQIGRASCRERV